MAIMLQEGDCAHLLFLGLLDNIIMLDMVGWLNTYY